MSELMTANGATAPVRPNNVQITIKRNVHHIEIDMDKLTWKDGKEIRKYQKAVESGELTEDQAVALMDTIIERVTGKHPDTMPLDVVNKVVAVLFSDDADAAAAEGN